MNHIIGILWFEDEVAYRRGLATFTDSHNMPPTFEAWETIVRRQLEEVRNAGNVALRVDFDPAVFIAWCNSRGFQPASEGRTGFVEYVVLEYEKTGKGTLIDSL